MTDSTEVPVIAVDGPAASGKGTLSRMLADALGWNLLDSGAIYRSLGLRGADQGLDATDWTAHLPLCENLKPQFLIRDGGVMVQLDDRDRTGELRSEAMGARAAQLARHMEIRDRVLQVQRDYRLPPGLVADGRDMATRVFTDASLAIYVTAEPEERARRRYLELKARGGSANICTLIEEIKERDRLDRERHASPLRKSPQARILDTTSLSQEDMCRTALAWVHDLPGKLTRLD